MGKFRRHVNMAESVEEMWGMELVSPYQASIMLGVSPDMITKLMKNGVLEKVGKSTILVETIRDEYNRRRRNGK